MWGGVSCEKDKDKDKDKDKASLNQRPLAIR